jgi:hypothetical protein
MKATIKILLLTSALMLSACQESDSAEVEVGAKPTAFKPEPPAVSPQRVNEFVHWYPAIEQAKMRDAWLSKYKPGGWQFTGKVTADDRTVVTPQSDVNYGYSWFNISNEPLTITMPKYDKYYSLSVFDMHHFMEVYVKPDKPVVIRLPHQKSPVKDAYEIVLKTYQGVALTRQVIVDNTEQVMKLAKNITLEGGGGDTSFVIPEFNEAEQKEGSKAIQKYLPRVKGGAKLFGSPYEGVGDMDRAAGVMIGQLGIQARYVDYRLYTKDDANKDLASDGSYTLTIPDEGLLRNKDGYWSLTVYNADDKYLIPNDKGIYNASMYATKKNADGTTTLRVNPAGTGDNAIPTAGKNWYAVLRVYEPVANIDFPLIKKEK